MTCDICKDDGLCKNNKVSNDFDEFYSDIYDCCDYIDKKEGNKVGWMQRWSNNIQKNEKPYKSNFSKWVETL